MNNLFGFGNEGGSKRDKVDFPVGLAVDKVQLRNIELNPNIDGVLFNFQRVEGDTIAFLSDTLLPPKQEWYTEDKTVGDKIVSAEEQYNAQVRSFIGYVRHILTNCGVDDHDLTKIGNHATLVDYINAMCKVVNPILETTKTLVYLKTVRDKAGYTKLPRYRGKGMIQNMELGKPNFEYTEYETQLLSEASKEGVVHDLPASASPSNGLDF